MRWVDFEQNWKNFKWDLCRVQEHASGVQDMFCLKSYIEGHRNGQLGSLAHSAWFWPVQLSCLAGCFYGLQSRISNKIYSEPLKHALSPRKGPVESFFQFHLKSNQRPVYGHVTWHRKRCCFVHPAPPHSINSFCRQESIRNVPFLDIGMEASVIWNHLWCFVNLSFFTFLV